MIPALLLAFLSGAIALSYEILWYRAFSFASGSRADTFGLLLGSYLVGLAAGSFAVGRWCRDTDPAARGRLLRGLALLTLFANALSYLVVPMLARLVSAGVRWETGLGLVGLAAAALGALFPLITHLWIAPDEKVGRNVSRVYLANILGSTLGSLLTGFVLMDVWTLYFIHRVLFLLGLVMAALPAVLGPAKRGWTILTVLLVLGSLVAFLGRIPFEGLYERLQEKAAYGPGSSFAHVVETRSGVITVNQKAQIFGGGIYDGAFNTSLQDDKNSIIRCYALAELHPAPKEVLMIGLSSGSWGTVIAANPSVERFTIVEINDGYLRLLPKYPDVAGLTANPKVSIEIDDGRRWMVRNTERRFDLIVANATFHWRSNATNLLSKEFLDLVRSRLKPGGVYYYNTTGSLRAVKTGCDGFAHSVRVGGFLAVSDSPLDIDLDRLRDKLYAYPRNGGVLLDRTQPGDAAVMNASMTALGAMIHRRPELLSATQGRRPMTDDNMGTEWEASPESY